MLANAGPGFEDFESYVTSVPLLPKRPVFRYGEGPPVVVLHELFGAGPTLFRFAHRIADAGFEVFVPILFGKANVEAKGDLVRTVRVCLSSEFASFSSGTSSPIADWVRQLGLAIVDRATSRHLGIIGLCLTGNIALTLACDDWIKASVVSEPALPLSLLSSGRRDLHITPQETQRIAKRVSAGFEILAFRFDKDLFSPAERDANLWATFAPGVLGNGCLAPTRRGAHAVFTDDFDERPFSSTAQALSELIAYLKRAFQG